MRAQDVAQVVGGEEVLGESEAGQFVLALGDGDATGLGAGAIGIGEGVVDVSGILD